MNQKGIIKGLPDFKITMPSDEELRTSSEAWYARVGHTFIDRWPDSVRALSFPTELVAVNAEEMVHLWDDRPCTETMQRYADLLDGRMGWKRWFIRLNSRSPKDASHPGAPITCAGKQAVEWIVMSERCLDDTCYFRHIDVPFYICLRKAEHLHKDGEFRCFAKDGEVISVTRYFYQDAPEHEVSKDIILNFANKFYNDNLKRYYKDIVFDIYMPSETLIEVNPYGLSDPCLFKSYDKLEGMGGFLGSKNDVAEFQR